MENHSDLIKRYLEGNLTEAERKALADRFASLPEAEADALFERLGTELDGLNDREIAVLEDKLRQSAPVKHPAKVRRLPATWLKAAAVIVVICAVGLVLYQNGPKQMHGHTEAIYVQQSNGTGKRSKITLEDGSVVWLNAVSKLRYPQKFDDKTREIYLEGEAFFEVKHEENRPFIVHSGKLNTQVLGTSFNIKAYPGEQLAVSVATGKVHVGDAAGKGLFLERGQLVNYLPGTGFSKRMAGPAADQAAWRNGVLNLDGVSLGDAVKSLERWYGKKIILKDPAMQKCMLAGKHTNESLDNVLQALRFILHFDYTYSADAVIISGKACQP